MSQIPDAISVIIPTYNRAHLIKESLQSVLDQTLKPYEIIVVDDFSTDNTEEVIKSLNSPLIKYVKNQRKKGANGARNTGILMAQGEYIAFHDSDDIWFTNKLESQYNFMRINQNFDLCFCSLLILDESESLKKIVKPKKKIKDKNIGYLLSNENIISTQTIFIKRSVANKILFDENIWRFQDWDFVIRVYQAGFKIYHLNTTLVKQIVNFGSISKNVNYKEAYDMICDKHGLFIKKSLCYKKTIAKNIFLQEKNIFYLGKFILFTILYRLFVK